MGWHIPARKLSIMSDIATVLYIAIWAYLNIWKEIYGFIEKCLFLPVRDWMLELRSPISWTPPGIHCVHAVGLYDCGISQV